MNSQELRAIQEAYNQVYELDEAEVLAQKGGVAGTVKVNKTKEGGFLGIGSKEVSKPVPGSFSPKDVSSKDAARYNTGIDKKFGSSDNIDNTSAANVQHAARSSGNSGYMKVKDPGSLSNTGIPNRPTPGRASDQNQAREMGSDIVRMNRNNRVREGSFDNLIDAGASVIKKPVQDYANKKIGGIAGTLGIPGAVAGQRVDQTASDLKKGNYGKALNTVVGGVRTLTQSYDLYDIILAHLLDEGYADTQEAATVIMANMSEDWRESIVEEVLNERRYDRDEKLPGSGKTPREKSDRKRGQHAARVMLGNPALGRSPRNDPERDSYSDRARMMDRVKNSQDKGEEPKDDEGRKNLIKAARRPRASYEKENRPGGLRAGNTKAGGHRTLKRKED
jgi:hypothetical protein